MSQESLADKIAKVASIVVGIGGVAFVYGMLVVQYQVFPWTYVRDAKMAASALYADFEFRYGAEFNVEMYKRLPNFWFPTDRTESGVTISIPEKQAPGYTFYTGSTTAAYLLNADGDVIHEWSLPFYEVWPEASHITQQTTEELIYWRIAKPLPDGSVVAIYEGINQSPYGGGMVKVDIDSNLLWSVDLNTHHNFNFTENGDIYVLTHKYEAEPAVRIDDYITILSPDGEEIASHSMLEGFRNSAFSKALPNFPNYPDGDFLHTNSIEVLSEDKAAAFPIFEAGDVLMSHKTNSTLTVFDGKSFVPKWVFYGMAYSNHDADWLDNGNILFLDNDLLGFNTKNEIHDSRILEIDPVTMELVWSYENSPDSIFYTQNRGSQVKFSNGNVLITESTGGRLLEVTPDGEIVWEFITPDLVDGSIAVVNWAQRYTADEMPFIKSLPAYAGSDD
jgi:outer membrane protein assembly factor BamB